jgi:predicted transcriptional regulator
VITLGDASRQKIMEIIQHEPGILKSHLRRRAGLANGTIGHHLRVLRGRQLIELVQLGGHLHVTPRRLANDVQHCPELASPLARKILARMLEVAGGIGTTHLSRITDATPRRVQHQLNHLKNAGLLSASESYHPTYALTKEGRRAAKQIPEELGGAR